MTFADLDHNDKLLAVGIKEKLEWVTPNITLMESNTTDGSKIWWEFEAYTRGSDENGTPVHKHYGNGPS